jgi:dsDNA-specific endonuclease/ATPase MutS2
MVEEFIRNAIELKIFRLRIIHGKGKSKLKWIVHNKLKKNSDVEYFGDAPVESGGWGATIVHLRNCKDTA